MNWHLILVFKRTMSKQHLPIKCLTMHMPLHSVITLPKLNSTLTSHIKPKGINTVSESVKIASSLPVKLTDPAIHSVCQKDMLLSQSVRRNLHTQRAWHTGPLTTWAPVPFSNPFMMEYWNFLSWILSKRSNLLVPLLEYIFSLLWKT